MFKLTSKTTVETMKEVLNANFGKVKKKDKTLADQIAYAGKNPEKATKKDLYDLVKQTVDLLGDKLIVPAMAEEKSAETSTKKLAKVESEQAVKPKVKTKKVESESEEIAESKKSAKKSASKKTEGVEVLAESSKISQQRAKKFPATITVGSEEYEQCSDIQSMDDLYDALNSDEEIILAFYWPKRNIKQFNYAQGLLPRPVSFEHDLDITTAIYASDEKKVAYSVSQYTEMFYMILPEDFEVVDGVRISGNIEFEIYRPIEQN